MAEYHTAKADYTLKINGTYENTLDIEGFAQMMKDPSYCYKFYWLDPTAINFTGWRQS